jgi:hypothetical protein
VATGPRYLATPPFTEHAGVFPVERSEEGLNGPDDLLVLVNPSQTSR